MTRFPLIIRDPSAAHFEGEAERVLVPGAGGELGVLARHAPMIVSLLPGVVRVLAGENHERYFALDGGVLGVDRAGAVRILASCALECESQESARAAVKEFPAPLTAPDAL